MNAFAEALTAAVPAADRHGQMALYGWLIGSWDLDVSEYLDDGSIRCRSGEWHFGWALEGRAIQDVWVVPARGAARAGDAVANGNYFGTTLRVYDPKLDAWHIQWSDPVSQIFLSMIGRKQGNDIVQLGTSAAGLPVRWSFIEIGPERFRWRGEWSADGGQSWRVRTEFLARRTAG